MLFLPDAGHGNQVIPCLPRFLKKLDTLIIGDQFGVCLGFLI